MEQNRLQSNGFPLSLWKKLSLVFLLLPLLAHGQKSDTKPVVSTITARELLEKVDQNMDLKIPYIRSRLSQVLPTGQIRVLDAEIFHKDNHYLYHISHPSHGSQEKILFRNGGEETWAFNTQSRTLFHKQGIDKFRSIQQTDFFYFDLSGSSLRANFTAKVLGQAKLKNRDTVKLELYPLFRSAVYGMLTVWVDSKSYLPLRIDYHDLDMVVFKTQTVVRVRQDSKTSAIIPERVDMLHISQGTFSSLEHMFYDEKREVTDKLFLHSELK